ncbi:hypothetical protein [Vibrio parahaemolyticus]|uniref:hypothetical protein n=2 Tax=Vibrio TaxID=662 RepID=UPI0006A720D2|nr:hypothetical protein [Vibrio parahaemolyticus]ELB2184150.1 hypothetical protein [Vibrio parahaemolyticus]KOE19672.1 hypothetical protein ACS85_02415 [Vibrio parahaemolyticus]TOB52516.1 hypothetical protein CGK03_23465 [Vibrio parahaemolyticus]
MHELQNPMTGIRNLESQLREGFVTRRVPFTDDIHLIKDKALGAARYTFARRHKNEVSQLVTFNGNQPLNGLPCFCLFYGTKEYLRGKGLTVEFVNTSIELLKKQLPKRSKPFYIEAMVEHDNEGSLAVARKLFGEPSDSGVDELTGTPTLIWQTKIE